MHRRTWPLQKTCRWVCRCSPKACRRAKATKKGKGKNGTGKGGDGKDDKKGEGKGKDNAKATEYFAGHCLGCKAWSDMKKDCWWNQTPKREGNREHSSQSTGLHDHWNASTSRRSQHGGRPTKWMFSVTKREPDQHEFLIGSRAATCQRANRVCLTAWVANPAVLWWISRRPLDNDSPRRVAHRSSCAHLKGSTCRAISRLRPRRPAYRDQS